MQDQIQFVLGYGMETLSWSELHTNHQLFLLQSFEHTQVEVII